MADKKFFSLIRKTKDGAVLRNADTNMEQTVSWEDLKVYFIERCKGLYYWNDDNPHQDEILKIQEQVQKEMGKIIAVYLLARKQDNISHMAHFGQVVEKYIEKYELNYMEFAQQFQLAFGSMFNEKPSLDGMLTFKDEK